LPELLTIIHIWTIAQVCSHSSNTIKLVSHMIYQFMYLTYLKSLHWFLLILAELISNHWASKFHIMSPCITSVNNCDCPPLAQPGWWFLCLALFLWECSCIIPDSQDTWLFFKVQFNGCHQMLSLSAIWFSFCIHTHEKERVGERYLCLLHSDQKTFFNVLDYGMVNYPGMDSE
jgi:hypothetical protein